MRKFLSNFLLSIFVIVFAFPVSTFAQYSWTPPAGPPTGNNTPSPINVSPRFQWKQGPAFLGPQPSGYNVNSTQIENEGPVLQTFGSVYQNTTNELSDVPASEQGFLSFLDNTMFAGRNLFQVGSNLPGIGNPQINLLGQLRYIPRNPNGSLTANQQPSAGKVLRAIDSSGLVGWGDATGLPQGGNNGDILIWDSTTNEWIVGPNSGGTGIDPGTSPWQTLSWNPVRNEWTRNDLLKVDDQNRLVYTAPNTNTVSLRTVEQLPGLFEVVTHTSDSTSVKNYITAETFEIDTDGTTLWTDYLGIESGVTDVSATDLYLRLGADPSLIDAEGKVLAGATADGKVYWADPATLGLGGGEVPALPAGAEGQTLKYSTATNQWEATSQIRHFSESGVPGVNIASPFIDIGNQGNGETTIFSPSLVFGVGSGPTQDVVFNSSSIQFKGPANNSPLEPGLGRIPFSTDADGTFKWNQNLTYINSVSGIPPNTLGVGQLRLRNPSNIPGASSSVAAFLNEGLTILEGSTYMYDSSFVDADLRISTAGDLYLDGVDAPSLLQGGSNLLPLCWNTQTNKVMRCTSTETGTGPIGPGDPGPGLGSIVTDTFYAGDHEIEFNTSGPVNLKWCGGGGGGGGGGTGNTNVGTGGLQNGPGGGGGGGGGKGDCSETTITVTAGDVLEMQVGAGGDGGPGGVKYYTGTNSDSNPLSLNSIIAASSGQTGGNTRVLLNNTQIGVTAGGGQAGISGGDALSVPGTGGNGAIDTWWNNGSSGSPTTSTIANPTPPPASLVNECISCGGKGGTGEINTDDSQTEIFAPDQSGRGGGGLSGPTTGNGTLVNNVFIGVNYLDRHGKMGGQGAPSNGGGGGGGSYGFPSSTSIADISNTPVRMNGGNGGVGGTGYVQVTYSSSSPVGSSDSIVFQDPGAETFQIGTSTVPGSTTKIIMEVWGGGGGGGPVTFSNQNISYAAGGGGSGAYRRIEWNLPTSVLNCLTGGGNNCGSMNINVGAGGALGISSGSSGTTGAAGAGQPSIVTYTPAGTTVPPGAGTSITAVGGAAGGISNLTNPSGSAGLGGQATGTGGQILPGGTSGLSGQTGNLGGVGGQAINGGFGAGGNGSKYEWVGGFGTPTPGTSGANGGVRISWE